jgi:glycerol-3-phosphate acyltransferase PlsY
VLRSGSKVAALAVLILDGAKGAFAMWLTALFTVGQSLVFLSAEELLALVGFAAFIGHLYPLFHRFQGGKGVATLLGILLFLHWPTGLTMGVVWLLTAKFSGYSSLAALIGSAVAALLFIALFHTDLQGAIVLAMVVILWLRHRGNLQRLLRREEGKINR